MTSIEIRLLNQAMTKALAAEQYGNAITQIAARYRDQNLRLAETSVRLGDLKIAPTEIESWVKELVDIVAPEGAIHTVERRVEYDRMAVIGKAAFFFGDFENAQALGEAVKYSIGTVRISADVTGARIFAAYVPFKITRHAVLRMIERSTQLCPGDQSGIEALSAFAQSLTGALHVLPCMVAAINTTQYPHFGLTAGDGVLLCEMIEETTTYEASEVYISAAGITRMTAASVFGNPAVGISRCIIGKTWIGPSELQPGQRRQIKKLQERYQAHLPAFDQFRDADLYRYPNWIDAKAPAYQKPELAPFIDGIKDLSLVLAQQEFRDAFRPPRLKAKKK